MPVDQHGVVGWSASGLGGLGRCGLGGSHRAPFWKGGGLQGVLRGWKECSMGEYATGGKRGNWERFC